MWIGLGSIVNNDPPALLTAKSTAPQKLKCPVKFSNFEKKQL